MSDRKKVHKRKTVAVVQLVRASDCGSECRGFESHQSPHQTKEDNERSPLFVFIRVEFIIFLKLSVFFEFQRRRRTECVSRQLYYSFITSIVTSLLSIPLLLSFNKTKSLFTNFVQLPR